MAKDKDGRLKITLSFNAYEEDIYNFLKSQKNTSAFVKRLVLSYMVGGGATPTTTPDFKTDVNVAEVKEVKEVKEDVNTVKEETKTEKTVVEDEVVVTEDNPSEKKSALSEAKKIDEENLKELKRNLPNL